MITFFLQIKYLWRLFSWRLCILALVLVVFASVLFVFSQHTLNAHEQVDLQFFHADNSLAGTLLLPKGPGPHPVVIFVHGDGPQDRGLEQYTHVMNAFLHAGIACFSWDKPGTGNSIGNWLSQTMAQRADEVTAAMQYIGLREDIQTNAIGLIGFSQGGWVLAEIVDRYAIKELIQQPAFFITVGAAVNFEQQGLYFTRKRLMREGFTVDEQQRVIDWQASAPQPIPNLSYSAYFESFTSYVQKQPPPPGAKSQTLSADRYLFIAINRNADLSVGLAKTKAPFLAIWGAQDENVDALQDAQTFANLLNISEKDMGLTQILKQRHAVKVFEGGEHKLLKATRYLTPTPEDWTWIHSLSYLIEGESAFVPGYLELLPAWAKAQMISKNFESN